jgi:alpha-glucosidase
MYQKIADGFQLSNTSHPFIFKNKKGHVVKIIVIAANVVRVQFLTEAAATEETYNTNSNTDASIQDKGDQIEFETPALRIVVVLEPAFQIKWYRKGQSEPFAEDLAYRSYGYDADTKWHYQRKHKDVLYYGLGERTGNLNLSNRRFRLDRLDCMGYDAETQDPLYKFCPFYIGLSNQSKQAYGIYYNNFSRTVVDLGQELDAVSF